MSFPVAGTQETLAIQPCQNFELHHPQAELPRAPSLSPSSTRDDSLSLAHSQNSIELQDLHDDVQSIPICMPQYRNYSAAEERMEKEKEQAQRKKEKEQAQRKKEKEQAQRKKEKEQARMKREKGDAKSASSGSSSALQDSYIQPPGRVEVQPSPELRVVLATPATTTRWVRFWSTVRCILGQNTDDHH